jgi:ketosteroid isomerase-like protein
LKAGYFCLNQKQKVMYHTIIKNQVKKSFQLVNDHRFAELAKSMSLNVRHSFAGDHAMGGVRNDQAAVKEWLERLGRLTPNLNVTITHINVEGWPHNTLAIVRWTATALLENGDPYYNKGVHFITLKWGKVTSLDVMEDSLAVANCLEKQYRSGIKEAKAPQIIS